MCPVVKQKEEPKKIPPKYLLLIFTILCIGLMVFTFTRQIPLTVAEDAAGVVMTDPAKAAEAVGTAEEAAEENGQTTE